MMKSILLLLFVILIGFTSCEGRRSINTSLSENINRFNEEHRFELNTYLPESYNETLTDTTLANGFKIKVKVYTNMAQSLIKTKQEDRISHNYHYREVKGQVYITYNNTSIFERVINKAFIQSASKISEDAFKSYNLEGIWVNHEDAIASDLVSFDIRYCTIDTGNCKVFNLIVQPDGSFDLKTKKDNIY